MADQQQQIELLTQQLASVEDTTASAPTGTPVLTDAAMHTGGSLSSGSTTRGTFGHGIADGGDSPLSFRIGGAEFTPGGFMDFESIFRTTNTGNSSGTVFSVIPFSNSEEAHLTELRMTGQSSLFSLKVTDKFGANNITGYIEMDFNGNDAGNLFVTSNSQTARMRLYWADLRRGKWEFLGGQTWGLETPNRVGVSPNPNDLFVDFVDDSQQHVGLNYTRAAAFRVAYHANDHWAVAAEVQNPQQYIGQGFEVTFPALFSATLANQVDAGSNSGTPNLAPDVIVKGAYDSNPGGKNFHVEAGGIMTTAKITNLDFLDPTGGFLTHAKVGGGVLGGVNLDLTKNIRFVASGLWGNGVGRYMIGMGPQFVVAPIPSSPTTFDAEVSLVHAADAIGGFELTPRPKTHFGVYYGLAYFQRNTFVDLTSSASTQPFIGFGGPNSGQIENRAIQEASGDWTETLLGSDLYGRLQVELQGSYLTRAPWFVAAGAPKDAHLFMAYASVRYLLPGFHFGNK